MGPKGVMLVIQKVSVACQNGSRLMFPFKNGNCELKGLSSQNGYFSVGADVSKNSPDFVDSEGELQHLNSQPHPPANYGGHTLAGLFLNQKGCRLEERGRWHLIVHEG